MISKIKHFLVQNVSVKRFLSNLIFYILSSVYLQVESSPGPYRFTVTTRGESDERRWKIRVSQIPCGSNALGKLIECHYY